MPLTFGNGVLGSEEKEWDTRDFLFGVLGPSFQQRLWVRSCFKKKKKKKKKKNLPVWEYGAFGCSVENKGFWVLDRDWRNGHSLWVLLSERKSGLWVPSNTEPLGALTYGIVAIRARFKGG